MSGDIFHGVTPFEETKNVTWLNTGPDLEYFERGALNILLKHGNLKQYCYLH